MRTSQRLDDFSDLGHAHPLDEHVLHGAIQLVSTAMVALKQLCVIPSSRARNEHIGDLSHSGVQMTAVVSIALVSTVLAALIRLGSNEGRHFFFQHTDECDANRVLQSLFHQLLKSLLTGNDVFDRVIVKCHGYPPGSVSLRFPVQDTRLFFTHHSGYCLSIPLLFV